MTKKAKTVVPAADKCTEAQRKHLLNVVSVLATRDVKDFPLNAIQKRLRAEIAKLEAKREQLQEQVDRWDSEDGVRKAGIRKELYRDETAARNAIHFRSQSEALEAVESLVARYEEHLDAKRSRY